HAGDHDPVRHQRGDNADIAFLVVGELLLPDLLAGLHVEGDDMTIQRLAEQLAVIDRGSPAHDGAGIPDPRCRALVLDRRAPEWLAGGDVDGKSPVAVHHVHDAVVDGRLRHLAGLVGKTRGPDRHQALDVRFADLAQRAVLVEAVPHAERGDILAVLAAVDQLLRGLRQCGTAPATEQGRQYFPHECLPATHPMTSRGTSALALRPDIPRSVIARMT